MNPITALRDLKAAGTSEPLADAIVALWSSTQETGAATRRDLEALSTRLDGRIDLLSASAASIIAKLPIGIVR